MSTQDLLHYADDENAAKFADEFHSLVMDRAADLLHGKRIELAGSMFGEDDDDDEEEVEMEDEDDEEFDEDEETEDEE
jgi:hypothetical protein